MCGLSGFIDVCQGRNTETLMKVIHSMNDSIILRGPDDDGVWVDETTGIALGHRRLSIIDRSTLGHQPMVSECGRYVFVYNGEVYNFKELRTELEAGGRKFRGHSDTEVILEGLAAWGVEATVERLIGMFSFGLWDRKERTLTLVRDRLGIKPLYWGRFGDLFLFGSELKALRAHPGWRPQVNRDALTSFMRHNYISAPMSIYEGVYKLQPGCILKVKGGEDPQIDSYGSLSDVAQEGQKNEYDFTDKSPIKIIFFFQ